MRAPLGRGAWARIRSGASAVHSVASSVPWRTVQVALVRGRMARDRRQPARCAPTRGGRRCTGTRHVRRPHMPATEARSPMTAPSTPAAAAVRGDDRHPLDAIFHPTLRRRHRRDGEAGQRRPDDPVEPLSQPVRRHRLPGQPEAAERPGHQGLPDASRRSPSRSTWRSSSRRRRPCPSSSRECGEAGVRGAIIISAGFKEVGAEGAELERQVLEQRARRAACASSARTAWA